MTSSRFNSIVIATQNPGKVGRYARLLSNYVTEVIGLRDLGITNKPDETGETAEENARLKARFYAKKSGQLVFSEDESLFVDFLPECSQPGVHVRRINGREEATDEELITHWENILNDIPPEERIGHWHIAYCIAHPDGAEKIVSLDHPIRFYQPVSSIRIPGWPMSSIEGPADFNKPHSEMTDEEKNIVDERSNKAIKEIVQQLLVQ